MNCKGRGDLADGEQLFRAPSQGCWQALLGGCWLIYSRHLSFSRLVNGIELGRLEMM